MRKVELPDIHFTALEADGRTARRVGVIEQLANLVSASGGPFCPSCGRGQQFSVEDMRTRIPILDKLDAHKDGEPLILEDAEYDKLKEILQTSMWMGVSRPGLALVDAVENAESVEVREAGRN